MDSKRVVDKSTWGDGAWQTEPDRWEGRHKGVALLAHRNSPGGNWCGYAAVPPGHPWHGKGYDAVEADVHGGLTYSDACQGHICHVPRPGEPDDVWWLGFDCHHGGDMAPGMEASMRLCSFGLDFDRMFAGNVYRDLAYVQRECRRLARQILRAAE